MIIKDNVSLRNLYEEIQRLHPSDKHDPDLFLNSILESVGDEEYRKVISKYGLDYRVSEVSPLKDVLQSSASYLIKIGVFNSDKPDLTERLGSNPFE